MRRAGKMGQQGRYVISATELEEHSMIRVALIGAGGQGRILARAVVEELAYIASLQVACDVDEAAARGIGAAEHCTDYRQAIDRDDVDAVFIVTPPGLHREARSATCRG